MSSLHIFHYSVFFRHLFLAVCFNEVYASGMMKFVFDRELVIRQYSKHIHTHNKNTHTTFIFFLGKFFMCSDDEAIKLADLMFKLKYISIDSN